MQYFLNWQYFHSPLSSFLISIFFFHSCLPFSVSFFYSHSYQRYAKVVLSLPLSLSLFPSFLPPFPSPSFSFSPFLCVMYPQHGSEDAGVSQSPPSTCMWLQETEHRSPGLWQVTFPYEPCWLLSFSNLAWLVSYVRQWHLA